MARGRVHLSPTIGVALLLLSVTGLGGQQPAPPGAVYNTVKQKLADGKQVVGGTISIPDPEIYCAMARSGFDFTWIEMQHSPLTYQDVARMIVTLPRRGGDPVHSCS